MAYAERQRVRRHVGHGVVHSAKVLPGIMVWFFFFFFKSVVPGTRVVVPRDCYQARPPTRPARANNTSWPLFTMLVCARACCKQIKYNHTRIISYYILHMLAGSLVSRVLVFATRLDTSTPATDTFSIIGGPCTSMTHRLSYVSK